jgi:hypothetical protein
MVDAPNGTLKESALFAQAGNISIALPLSSRCHVTFAILCCEADSVRNV